jgi:hypothetical protein
MASYIGCIQLESEKMLNPEAPSKLGVELTASEQSYVLRSFVHRFTKDHIPTWVRLNQPNGKPYKVQFRSDNEWLARTRFQVTKTGKLDKRVRECNSSPTWPAIQN